MSKEEKNRKLKKRIGERKTVKDTDKIQKLKNKIKKEKSESE